MLVANYFGMNKVRDGGGEETAMNRSTANDIFRILCNVN